MKHFKSAKKHLRGVPRANSKSKRPKTYAQLLADCGNDQDKKDLLRDYFEDRILGEGL